MVAQWLIALIPIRILPDKRRWIKNKNTNKVRNTYLKAFLISDQLNERQRLVLAPTLYWLRRSFQDALGIH